MEAYRRAGGGVRPTFGADAEAADRYFRRFVTFVDDWAPHPGSRILDVGCGSGWTTLQLRARGHDAHGLDLHLEALEVDVPYSQGDVRALPFADGSFEVVAMYQVLEHVPDAEGVLEECRRVLVDGGRLVVVGPNLLSVPLAVLAVGRAWRRWRRTPGLPRHPFGNTVPEVMAAIAHHTVHTAGALLGMGPSFIRRDPDPNPPFHADNDASWFCNPMDLRAWGRRSQMQPLRWWASDRRGARLYWPFAGGTWIVLER